MINDHCHFGIDAVFIINHKKLNSIVWVFHYTEQGRSKDKDKENSNERMDDTSNL